MKNYALLIELDNIRQTFATLLAIVKHYQGCKIFECHSNFKYYINENGEHEKCDEYILNAETIDDGLDYLANDQIYTKIDCENRIERKRWKNLRKEINQLRKHIGIIDSKDIKFNDDNNTHLYTISEIEIKQIDKQALALLYYFVYKAMFYELFIITPLNTPMDRIIKYYMEDLNNAHKNHKVWLKYFIQAIKSLSNDLDFMLLTRLWADNDTALFSCADKEMFHLIKNLPENNQLLFNRAYDFYYKPVVDYSDEILLNACPCDGVYVGSYAKQ